MMLWLMQALQGVLYPGDCQPVLSIRAVFLLNIYIIPQHRKASISVLHAHDTPPTLPPNRMTSSTSSPSQVHLTVYISHELKPAITGYCLPPIACYYTPTLVPPPEIPIGLSGIGIIDGSRFRLLRRRIFVLFGCPSM